jgi:octanoyl-[GcvH]:protein N-octanoyltransferase
MDLSTVSHRGQPVTDMALSAVLLGEVADRRRRSLLRIYRPGPSAAFGKLDRLQGGFPAARDAATAVGLVPMLRLAGGRLACYDEACVIVEIFRAEESVIGGLEGRFEDLAQLISEALAAAGVSVEVGELPGEYCPGRFSLHLPDGPKVAGIAQRIIRGASLTSAVVVAAGGARLRAAIAEIYAALGIAVDPELAGAVNDRHPSLNAEDVFTTLRRHSAVRYGADEIRIPPQLSRSAAATAARFAL